VKKVLILNREKEKCGVYQFGLNVYLAMKSSQKYEFVHAGCANQAQMTATIQKESPDVLIFNYYHLTMPWVTPLYTRSFGCTVLGTFHEVTAAFDLHICLDPDVKEVNPAVKALGRIVPPYENSFPEPDLPTFGAFGFGLRSQGYETIIKRVQEEYDKAKIRLHIPENQIVDPGGRYHASRTIQYCKNLIVKSGIELEVSQDFLSKEDLLDFLAQNTANCFFKDPVPGRKGKSSALDFGLAVQRPILLTKCEMYDHVSGVTPSPYIEDRSIRDIVADGFFPFESYRERWSEENFKVRLEEILDEVTNG
jgi:hypothetical protein